MSQRLVHCASSQTQLLASVAHTSLGRFADGTVAAVSNDAALSLLRSRGVSVLYFSRESYDRAIRRLSEPDVDAVVRKRLVSWSPNAVNEGVDWLYQRERSCLTLSALALRAPGSRPASSEHFEHTMVALHRLVNEGAYGNVTLSAILIYLLEREALLVVELSQDQANAEVSAINQFSLAVAQELRGLGRSEFAQHLPYVEAERAVLVSSPDGALRTSLKIRHQPFVNWEDGLVSTFGVRDLDSFAQQGRKVRILYMNGSQFLQDFTDLTPAQLQREFQERLEAGPMPFWRDHLNFLRLETALMRRAAHEKAAAINPRIATALRSQILREAGMLAAALAKHPSWLNTKYQPQDGMAEAETEVLDDATFLAELSSVAGSVDVRHRYQSFVEFKTALRPRS